MHSDIPVDSDSIFYLKFSQLWEAEVSSAWATPRIKLVPYI